MNKPQPPRRPSRLSRARPEAGVRPAGGGGRPVTLALDARLHQALGWTGPPNTVQCAAALLQALRITFPDEVQRWFPLVPENGAGRLRDPAREHGLDLADLRVLHRALRVAWLAELVFGERDIAHLWLCQPKRRLHGRVPLLLSQFGRYAQMIEQWLIDIDEGNGP